MPCWEVRLMSVQFKAAHKEILIEALKELGWAYREEEGIIYLDGRIMIDLKKEQIKCPQDAFSKVNELKRKYSEVTIKKVAAKKKWSLRVTEKNKFQIRKWA